MRLGLRQQMRLQRLVYTVCHLFRSRVERELGLSINSSKNKFKGLVSFALWTHLVLNKPADARKLYSKAVLADPSCERVMRARRCFAATGGDQILTLRQKKDRKAFERRKWRVAKKKGLAMGGAREEAKAQLQNLRKERSILRKRIKKLEKWFDQIAHARERELEGANLNSTMVLRLASEGEYRAEHADGKERLLEIAQEMRQVRDVITAVERVLGIHGDASKAEVQEAARKRARMVAMNNSILCNEAVSEAHSRDSRRVEETLFSV